jgi:hypothetical protein
MQRVLVIAAIASSAACKTDDAKRAAPRPAPAAPGAPAPAPGPGPARGHELIDMLLLHEPMFADAAPLAPLKVIEERERAQQSWCMSGTDAQAIANVMASTLTSAGWGDIRVRGTSERAAVSGTVEDISISITVGGRDATCTGLVATAHYSTSTVIIPPVDDGERVR